VHLDNSEEKNTYIPGQETLINQQSRMLSFIFVHNPHDTPCKSYNSFALLATTKLYETSCKSCLPSVSGYHFST